MKSMRWEILEQNNNIIINRLEKNHHIVSEKSIDISDDGIIRNISLYTGSNGYNKVCNYKIKYNTNTLVNKRIDANFFNLIYTPMSAYKTAAYKTEMDIIYEDHNLRILSFKVKTDKTIFEDYLLVGRWKI